MAAARSINGSLPAGAVGAVPGLISTAAIPQGLYVKNMSVTPLSGSPRGAVYNIGFAQGLGAIDASSGAYLSNTQTVNLIYSTAFPDYRWDGCERAGR